MVDGTGRGWADSFTTLDASAGPVAASAVLPLHTVFIQPERPPGDQESPGLEPEAEPRVAGPAVQQKLLVYCQGPVPSHAATPAPPSPQWPQGGSQPAWRRR